MQTFKDKFTRGRVLADKAAYKALKVSFYIGLWALLFWTYELLFNPENVRKTIEMLGPGGHPGWTALLSFLVIYTFYRLWKARRFWYMGFVASLVILRILVRFEMPVEYFAWAVEIELIIAVTLDYILLRTYDKNKHLREVQDASAEGTTS